MAVETKYKLNLYAEPNAIIQLGRSDTFRNSGNLKAILKRMARIVLLMDKTKFQEEWEKVESPLRHFFQSYDLDKPKVYNELLVIYNNPALCCYFDPFGIWLFNRSQNELRKFKELLGVWAISPEELNDKFFYYDFSKAYEKDDILDGIHDNGWGNFLENVHHPLPPINGIVLNDRYLLETPKDNNKVIRNGFYGLKNLVPLLNEFLPSNLKVPFHITIVTSYPDENVIDAFTREQAIDNFYHEIVSLRTFPIEIKVINSRSKHKRGLYSNYYTFDADRGFNAFCLFNMKQFNGENDLSFYSLLKDPFNQGDTQYQISRSKITKIKEMCPEDARNNRLFG